VANPPMPPPAIRMGSDPLMFGVLLCLLLTVFCRHSWVDLCRDYLVLGQYDEPGQKINQLDG
jgi:hypothetical protein